MLKALLLEFRILGPLEVETADGIARVGGSKQRALLAFLVLNANRVVSRDHLIEAIWGDHPPASAAAALQGYVSALRKTLGPDRIVTKAPGYLLRADADSIDLTRFEQLTRTESEAHTTNAAAKADMLERALSLWRGEPLSDLEPTPLVEIERRRLVELRLAAIEERMEARLALGDTAAAAAELDALTSAYPLRERLRGQLMVALYRSGRQAEALATYQQARHHLAHELGLEPGEALKQLERAILVHDPALGAPLTPGRRVEEGRRAARRIVRTAVLGVVALAIVGAAALAVAMNRHGDGVRVVANSVAVIDPQSARVVADVRLGAPSDAIAVGSSGVWVASEAERTLTRISPRTRKIVSVIHVGRAHDLALGFGSVWVANGTDGTVSRIDASRNRVSATVRLDPATGALPAFWIARGANEIWVTLGRHLLAIDPRTNDVVARIATPTPTGLAAGPGAVWLATDSDELLRVPTHGTEAPARLALRAGGVAPAVGPGSVWVIAYHGRGEIWRIDPRGRSIEAPGDSIAVSANTAMENFPLDIAVGEGRVWSVDAHGTVSALDIRTGRVLSRVATAPTVRAALAAGRGAVWVALQDSGN